MSAKRQRIMALEQADIEQVLFLVATHCHNSFLLVNRAICAKARELGPLRTSYRWLTANTLGVACDYGLPRDSVSDRAVSLRDPALLAEALQRDLPGFTSIPVWSAAVQAGLFPDIELVLHPQHNPRKNLTLIQQLIRMNQLSAIQAMSRYLHDLPSNFAFLALKGSDAILDWAIEQGFQQVQGGYGAYAYPDQCKIWSQDGYMQLDDCLCLDCKAHQGAVVTLLDAIASYGWRRFAKYLPRLRKWTLHSVCHAFKSSAPDRLVLVRWLLDQRPEIGWALPCLIYHIADLDAATASWLFAHCRPAVLQMTDNWNAICDSPKALKTIRASSYYSYFNSLVSHASFNLFAVVRTLIEAGNIPMLEFFVSIGFKWTAEYYYTAAALNAVRVLTWARQRFLIPGRLAPAEFVPLRQQKYDCQPPCCDSEYVGTEGLRWLLTHGFPMDYLELAGMLYVNMTDELVAQLESATYLHLRTNRVENKFTQRRPTLDTNDCSFLVQTAKHLDRLDWVDRLSAAVKAHFVPCVS